MATYLTIQISYDPEIVDRDMVVDEFDGHDGGGFCFLDGVRDEFFIIDDPSEEYVKDVRKQARNVRRRKGIVSCGVDVINSENDE